MKENSFYFVVCEWWTRDVKLKCVDEIFVRFFWKLFLSFTLSLKNENDFQSVKPRKRERERARSCNIIPYCNSTDRNPCQSVTVTRSTYPDWHAETSCRVIGMLCRTLKRFEFSNEIQKGSSKLLKVLQSIQITRHDVFDLIVHPAVSSPNAVPHLVTFKELSLKIFEDLLIFRKVKFLAGKLKAFESSSNSMTQMQYAAFWLHTSEDVTWMWKIFYHPWRHSTKAVSATAFREFQVDSRTSCKI